MHTTTSLTDRLAAIQQNISDAAAEAGRSADEITLIAVCKTFPRDAVDAAHKAGVRHFGENRVQEAQGKFKTPIADGATLHLIGHLQSNKAKFIPGLFQAVDSIDRASVITALDKALTKADARIDVLVQVNVAGESQKAGCAPEEAPALINQLAETDTMIPRGFMTIAPVDAVGNDLRNVFRDLRKLRDETQAGFPTLDLRELSMGMSNDYREAIAEGATQIRIGRAIFGDR